MSYLYGSLGVLLRAREISRQPETLDPAIRVVLIEACGGYEAVQQSDRLRRLIDMKIDLAYPPAKVRQAKGVGCGVIYMPDGSEVRSLD